MAVQRPVTERQEDLISYMTDGKPRHVSNFFVTNREPLTKFFLQYDPDFDLDQFVATFRHRNPEGAKRCRQYISECMVHWAHALPDKDIRLPKVLRDEYKRVAKEKRRIQITHDIDVERRLLKETKLKRKQSAKILVPYYAAKALSERIALTLSKMGFTVPERMSIQAGFIAPFIAKAAFSTVVAAGFFGAEIQDAKAAVPPTADIGAISQPLKITIRPNASEGSTLAYNTTSKTFGSIANIIDDMMGKFEDETPAINNHHLYNPFLVKQLTTDIEAQKFVELLTQAAKRCDLDPVLFVNQMHRESRQFDHDIVYGPEKSSANAMGLTQIIKSTGSKYGLKTDADYFDPVKSINTGADIMCDLTAKYGDQIVAAAAYNGGEGAVKYALEETGKTKITGAELIKFFEDKRAEHGPGSTKKWRNQTYTYMREINGEGWEQGHTEWAIQQQKDGLPLHMSFVAKITGAPLQGSKLSFGLEETPKERAPRGPNNG